MSSEYPDRYSIVTVTDVDGVVSKYPMSAGVGIANYLAEQTGRTGCLSIMYGGVSRNIMSGQIADFKIEEKDFEAVQALHSLMLEAGK